MSRLYRFRRQASDLKTLHHRRAGTLPFLSSFSTFAAESDAGTESVPESAASTKSVPEQAPYVPPLIGIALTNKVGRAAFASEKLTPGTVLHSARPMVAHPYLSTMNCVCYFCLRRLPKRDAGPEAPRTATFCSEKCEADAKKFYDVEKQADWSRFHEYCQEQGLQYPLLIKRFACQIIARNINKGIFELLEGVNSPDRVPPVKEDFDVLRSTLEDANIKVEKKDNDENKSLITGGKEDERPLSFLTKEWYTDTLGRIRINAFRVELPLQSQEDDPQSAAAANVEREAVGDVMYMLPSFYNHSCDPNVKIEWIDNAEAKMVALRDIKEDEEVRICYLDANMDNEARKQLLYERYGFHCDCPKCVVPKEGSSTTAN